jgi:hypothetical protein
MKFLVMAMAVSSVLAPKAAPAAGDTEKALQLRPKAAMTSAMTPVDVQRGNAPFVSPLGEPELALSPRHHEAQEGSRSSCNNERALCYDSASGRVVYRPARQLMPDLPGMRPENISLKRNQIVFRYSFQ